MPATSSFDVTSTIDFQEVDNALNQARKEVGQRYDFKGAIAEIDLNAVEKKLTLTTSDEMKMNALWEIVQTRQLPVEGRPAGSDARAARARFRRRAAVRQLSMMAGVSYFFSFFSSSSTDDALSGSIARIASGRCSGLRSSGIRIS